MDALAAASGATLPLRAAESDWDERHRSTTGMLAAADHAALAHVTKWMRDNEHRLEWGKQSSEERDACRATGELHGWGCKTFTYGSTYFQSWLQLMRFPAVDRALSSAAGGQRQRNVVVLGSSLGWQTVWAALTFGINAVGYELMQHRIDAARLAASQVEATSRSTQFFHSDALRSSVSSAAVIYATDLAWDVVLANLTAGLIRGQLLAREDHGKDVVIISNNYNSWVRPNFVHIGKLTLPVSWKSQQTFHIWSVEREPRRDVT